MKLPIVLSARHTGTEVRLPFQRVQPYPHFNNRVISASSGKCNEHAEINATEPATIRDPNGLNYISAVNFTYPNGTFNGSIMLPTSASGREGTTYIYRDVYRPRDTKNIEYCDRGLSMWAYRNAGECQTNPSFFECPVFITPVFNAVKPNHNIDNGIAKAVIASIALQGFYASG